MNGRVEGKVALVTGAARGQGRSHAVRLAREGAHIIAVDLCAGVPGTPCEPATPADLAETADLVGREGGKIVTAQVDVCDLEALTAAVAQGVEELGRLDVVVANAAICISHPWDTVTPESFDTTMAINVRGVWNTVMAGSPHLIAAGGGSVILISSSAGIKVQPFMLPYTTSKWAVRGMAKAFAAELAKHNIRVNSVHPAGVNSPMLGGRMIEDMMAAIETDPRLGGMLTNMIDVMMLEPEDISNTVLFLASEESKYMTAHELMPDAGVTEM